MPRNAQGGYDKDHQPNWSDPVEVENYKSWLGKRLETEGSSAPDEYKKYAADPTRQWADKYGFDLNSTTKRRLDDARMGEIKGEEAFATPEMMQMQRLREDMAKGYSGEVGGALRETARKEIAGQQQAQARKLGSAAARGGVGGARGAAMQAANARKGGEAVADAERKMAIDSFQMQQKGADNLQDYLFRKTFAKLGAGGAYASMGSADNAAKLANEANQGGDGFNCCFIFLEARYGDGTMDYVVRRFRDENMTDVNRRGYYKLSEVLVPLMRKSKIVKGLVRLLMTDPLVAYGKAYYGTGSKLGFVFTPVKNFWLKTFLYLGGDHEFIRENGEVV